MVMVCGHHGHCGLHGFWPSWSWFVAIMVIVAIMASGRHCLTPLRARCPSLANKQLQSIELKVVCVMKFK